MPRAAKSCLKFSKTEFSKISAPTTGCKKFHDTDVKGLVLYVYASSQTFYVYKFVDGKPTRIKLGNFPDMSVEQARTQAIQVLSSISKGETVKPNHISKKTEYLLNDLVEKYIEEYARHHCTTWLESKKNFTRYFHKWLAMPATAISLADVQQRLNEIGRERGHHTANRAYDDLRAVYSWATKYGYFKAINPCTGVTKFKTRSRERFIRPDEFERFLNGLKTETNIYFRDYVYLSLFTGARQGNILAMRWQDINFDLGLWQIPITKNRESQTVPLTSLALEVLKDRFKQRTSETWVFPSDGATGHIVEPKNAWRKLMERTALEDLRMHDLRRTLGSYMAMNNQSLQIIGKVLGHKSPTATQIYSRLSADPLKDAMEAAQTSMTQKSITKSVKSKSTKARN